MQPTETKGQAAQRVEHLVQESFAALPAGATLKNISLRRHPFGSGPLRAGSGEDRARADSRGRHAGMQFRVQLEAIAARRSVRSFDVEDQLLSRSEGSLAAVRRTA